MGNGSSAVGCQALKKIPFGTAFRWEELDAARSSRCQEAFLSGSWALKAHLRPDFKAKFAPFRGTCMRTSVDFWNYDLCFGSRIVQFREDAGLRHSLGEFQAGSEHLLPSGEARGASLAPIESLEKESCTSSAPRIGARRRAVHRGAT